MWSTLPKVRQSGAAIPPDIESKVIDDEMVRKSPRHVSVCSRKTPPGTAFDAGTGDLIGVKWQGWQLVIGSAHDLITELSKKLPDVPDEDKPVLREQATQLRNELDVLLALAA